MDRLWAPWRVKYIRGKKNRKCIFCFGRTKDKDYLVFKTKYSQCMLNIYPYNNGHLMVAPIRHVKDISLLSDREAEDLFLALKKAKLLLDKTLRPQGYNIGLNIGVVGGAGFAGHLHIHIVPRWKGDTNFMPVVFDTKLVSQSLDELYKILLNAKSKVH